MFAGQVITGGMASESHCAAIVVLAKVGAGSVNVTVPGSGGVTVPGLQAYLTFRKPPIVTLITTPPCSKLVVVLSGVTVSSRNSIVPLAPAVHV
jgi:hypothetical protein